MAVFIDVILTKILAITWPFFKKKLFFSFLERLNYKIFSHVNQTTTGVQVVVYGTGGGYNVPPLNILAPGRARGLIFYYLVHIYHTSYLKKEFSKSVKMLACSRKNVCQDFFWPTFFRNFVFAILNAFFDLETWNLVEMCIFIWGTKKVKLTIGLKLLFTP